MKSVFVYLFIIAIGAHLTIAQDLGINFNDYTNGQNITSGKIQTAFTITNYGPSSLQKGNVVYVGTKINGTYYNLDLTASGGTPITLTRNIAVKDTFMYNPGYLDGALTLSFLGVDSVQVCLLVYGVGISSVGSNFPSDPNPSNNTACVLYGKSGTTSGIMVETIENYIRLYPVPATNQVNIQFSKSGINRIQFIDLTGKLIKEISVHSESETIDISEFEKGVYIYKIFSNNELVKADRIIVI